MRSQVVQIVFKTLAIVSCFIQLSNGLSANHQHQITYSEIDDESHYGYKSSPLSVSYVDDDSYGSDESSSRVITGSGRMAVLGKRSSQEPFVEHQGQVPFKGNEQQQKQGKQNDQSRPSASYHVEWTESVDHGPSKSSGKSPSYSSPISYSQTQSQFPVQNHSPDYPSQRSSSSSLDDSNTRSGGYPYTDYRTPKSYQGNYNEPSVGYSESKVDSEWVFPTGFLKELKRTEKEETKDEYKKDQAKKQEAKKPRYHPKDHWSQDPIMKEEEKNDKKEEEKKDDKFDDEWNDHWNEEDKKGNKEPEKKEKETEKEKNSDAYGNKLKKEEGSDDEGKHAEKKEYHTHQHHDHWSDPWTGEPKKEKYGDKKKEKVHEYGETYDKKEDDKVSLPVYSEQPKKPTVKDNDSWYDSGIHKKEEEEKYQEPSKKDEHDDKGGEYYDNHADDNHHDDEYSKTENDGDNHYDYHGDHDDKPVDDKLESPEQIGRRPGDSKEKGHKGGGLVESYFWKALPGWGDKNDNSRFNYVIHVSKIDLDKARGKETR